MAERQWSIQAEDGTKVYTSEDVARQVAEGDTGYTLGIKRAPAVAAFTRTDPDGAWEPVTRPGKPDPTPDAAA